jgi:glycosyltransferase involved in cell wall biosynthesis
LFGELVLTCGNLDMPADHIPARVNILLGIYNGSRFLSGQLQSIDAQTLPPHRITIRDEGSTDDSVLQVQRWATKRPNVSILSGPRLGVLGNFFTLLASEDNDSDCFAFCDQDDIWLPDKLLCAVQELRKYGDTVPVMYCSRVEYVDENLRHLGYSSIPREPNFANALVENIATGCTVVLNRSARNLISQALPRMALMHDWWSYLVVSAFGRVCYDQRPNIKYRQHAGNLIGATTAPMEAFKRRYNRFLERPPGSKLLTDQAGEFKRCFGKVLNPEYRFILERFLRLRGNLWTRISYNFKMDVWRQTWIDTTILRTMILIGRV